ncbi:hypothetical protein C2E23DRAFT_813626 [Lenzites betulinus]|nr:hypothetical protein C2E23DRAFT_813626 [Lenzites betulinus]
MSTIDVSILKCPADDLLVPLLVLPLLIFVLRRRPLAPLNMPPQHVPPAHPVAAPLRALRPTNRNMLRLDMPPQADELDLGRAPMPGAPHPFRFPEALPSVVCHFPAGCAILLGLVLLVRYLRVFHLVLVLNLRARLHDGEVPAVVMYGEDVRPDIAPVLDALVAQVPPTLARARRRRRRARCALLVGRRFDPESDRAGDRLLGAGLVFGFPGRLGGRFPDLGRGGDGDLGGAGPTNVGDGGFVGHRWTVRRRGRGNRLRDQNYAGPSVVKSSRQLTPARGRVRLTGRAC